MPENEPRRSWERVAEWPLTATATMFLAAYAWPILDPGLSSVWVTACLVVTWAAWAAFALDYVVRLALSRRRLAFVRANLLDLAVIALPLLRPLRLLRLLVLLSAINRQARTSLRGRVIVYAAGATVLVLFVSSLSMLDAERSAEGANIIDYGDAIWWAATTVTTVGYGDRFPTTGTGRLAAPARMRALR